MKRKDMQRQPPQPQPTRVPRLRDATPGAHDPVVPHQTSERTPRIRRGKSFRLRNVHPD